MTTYRTGNHWGVTIVREGEGYPAEVLDDCAFCCVGGTGCPLHPAVKAQLVAVVVNGDQALAERICALLNNDVALVAAAARTVVPTRRLKHCVDSWPDAETGKFNPSCCRWPKSCSATAYDPAGLTDADLEPIRDAPSGPSSAPQSASDASGVPEPASSGSETAETLSERFEVRGVAAYEDPQLVIDCRRCDWGALYDDPTTLAELNQRADEHTEGCR